MRKVTCKELQIDQELYCCRKNGVEKRIVESISKDSFRCTWSSNNCNYDDICTEIPKTFKFGLYFFDEELAEECQKIILSQETICNHIVNIGDQKILDKVMAMLNISVTLPPVNSKTKRNLTFSRDSEGFLINM